MEPVTAELVYREDGEPLDKILAVKFEHGRLKSDQNVDCDYKVICDENGERMKSILTIPGKEKLCYVGETCQPDETFRYYIGCLNKKTGKMTVHDAEIFNMKPKFADEQKAEMLFPDQLTYRQQVDRVDAKFGSSKKKKAVSARQKFDNVYGEKYSGAVDTAIEHAITQPEQRTLKDSSSASKSQSTTQDFLPPCNLDAENPQDVYTAANLISSQSLVALKSPAEVFCKRTREQLTDWTDAQAYPWYILELMKVMPAEDEQRWERAKCITYLLYMMTLFRYKPADFKKINCLPAEWPDVVKKELLEKFTMKSVADKGQKSVRYFPARLKDKLLLYILAMSLAIEDAQLDPSLLVQDLAISEMKVYQFYRSLGCTVSSKKSAAKKIEQGEPTVVLKVPLKLPSLSTPMRRTKKRKFNL